MAAGKGTRMKSRLPKVLHRLAGRALLQHVVDTATALSARRVVVITGHGAAEVETAVRGFKSGVDFVRQEPQLGTGHAVQQAVPVLPDDGVVVVLSGRTTTVDYRLGDTLLETARRAGLSPPFSCELGSCATCMARLREGAATLRVNNALAPDELDAGWVLTCQAVPTSRRVVVDYDA